MGIRRLTAALAVIAAVMLLQDAAWGQCAMCRTALENSAEGQAVAEGFRHGILLMLAAPYAIIASIAYGVFRAFRKRKSSHE